MKHNTNIISRNVFTVNENISQLVFSLPVGVVYKARLVLMKVVRLN